MKIYKDEVDIQEQITASANASVITSIKISQEKLELLNQSILSIKESKDSKLNKIIASIDDDHPDFMYGSAILASTVMNKNDDIFIPEETWKARNTPKNSPFNQDHEETDIIGHIIGSRVLDAKGDVIDDDEPVGEEDSTKIPEYFDIEADFVVYKNIYPEIAAEIAAKAPEGKQFVSMECNIDNFDYGLIDESNEMTIIARNDNTSFLTKYLRRYDGPGKYENYRIGRVLRGIRFNGMGNVEKPANPKSIYTKIEAKENKKVVSHIIEGKIMKIENLEDANKLIAELTKEVATLKADIEKNKEASVKAELETVKAENVSLKDKLTAETTKITVANEEITGLKTKLSDASKEQDTLKAKTEELNKELAAYKDEKKKADRKDKMAKAGIKFSDEAKIEKILSMSDEAFNSVIEYAESTKTTETSTETEPTATSVAKAENAADKALETTTSTETKATASDIANAAAASDENSVAKTAEKLIASLRKANKKIVLKK